LLSQLVSLVDSAEAACKLVLEEGEPLAECDDANAAKSPEDVLAMVKTIEEAGVEAKAKVKACTDMIAHNGVAMRAGDRLAPPQEPKAEENAGEEGAEPVVKEKPNLAKLLTRVNDSTRSIDGVMAKAKTIKDSASRKWNAFKKVQALEATFAKYDKNRDGLLDKKEVAAYALGEFQLKLETAVVDSIFKALGAGTGVKKELFYRVKAAVGIQREKQLDNRRREARLEKERQRDAAKAKLQARVDEAVKKVGETEEKVNTVEEASVSLTGNSKAELSSTEMLKEACVVEDSIKITRDQVAEIKKISAALCEDVAEDMQAWLKEEEKKLDFRSSRLETRLAKASAQVSKFQDEARKKDTEELLIIEEMALKVIKYEQQVNEFSNEDMFGKICSGEAIKESQFVAFLTSKPVPHHSKFNKGSKFSKDPKRCKPGVNGQAKTENGKAAVEEDKIEDGPAITAADAKRLFAAWDEEEEGSLNKDVFIGCIQIFARVIADTMMSAEIVINKANPRTIRRLEAGEALDVLQGPFEDAATKCMRVQVKALKDNKVGWATMLSNAGTALLEEGGGIFCVKTETILTAKFDLEDDGSKISKRRAQDVDRKLKVGELVKVRVWPAKEDKSGLMRMKCRCQADGAVGWVTTIGNQGTVFLESSTTN